MQLLRPSSFDEFVEWYLQREFRKGGSAPPPLAAARRATMAREHAGKLRQWFAAARWSLVLLDRNEFEQLIFLESDWTRNAQLVVSDGENYRLLRRVAENARNTRYLDTAAAERHRKYYQAIADCHFRLECSSRLTICDADVNERRANPAAQHYLHDGAGRTLAYMLFLLNTNCAYEPVEAFLAST
jgi:hypothetical protein